MLTKDQVQAIKMATNIVDVISEDVPLKKSGSNYLGCCPFHDEKTPSFSVREDKQFYHCFGCHKSGDVFSYLQEKKQMTFLESLAYLAHRQGIVLDDTDFESGPKREDPHQALYDLYDKVTQFYHAYLATTKMGESAKDYLADRGIDDEVINHFQIGLAPNKSDLLYATMHQTFDEEVLLRSGIFTPSESGTIFDQFAGRIIFPLIDEKGRSVAFSGRKWTKEDEAKKTIAKYKNSTTTPIFNKRQALYHFGQAKAAITQTKEVYVMEGFMDVIAAYRSGIHHAVATMGTAFTAEHAKQLERYADTLILSYDGDEAGQVATQKAVELLADQEVLIVKFPDGLDPDDYLRKNSSESLAKYLLQTRISPVEFMIDRLRPANLSSLQQQIMFVETIAPIIASDPSMTAQNAYCHKVADLLPDFDFEQIEASVNQVRLSTRHKESREATASNWVINPVKVSHDSLLVKAEKQLLARLSGNSYALSQLSREADFVFSTPTLQVLYTILKEKGAIDPLTLHTLAQEVQDIWYSVESLDLPEEALPSEIEEIRATIERERQKQDERESQRLIKERMQAGQIDAATQELASLITKRKEQQ